MLAKRSFIEQSRLSCGKPNLKKKRETIPDEKSFRLYNLVHNLKKKRLFLTSVPLSFPQERDNSKTIIWQNRSSPGLT